MIETPLLTTLVMSFLLAFVCGVIAAKLRFPPIVGYLIAGIILGPYTPGFVADQEIAGELAEIGVILLMFGVGLHFSFEDLTRVWRIAVPGALAQIILATMVGGALGFFWGWPLAGSIIFGLAISVASTVVLLRLLDNKRAIHTEHGRLAVGWLVVEDIAMVLALVALPSLAGILTPENGVSLEKIAMAVTLTIGKLVLFIAIAFLVGRKFIPWVLRHIHRMRWRELFTLAVLTGALGIAYGSSIVFGVSFALGAFFAGVVMHESELSQRATHDSLPFQDIFAVLFFVSVGMLFNPAILFEHPLRILAVLFVIMIVKFVVAVMIMRILKRPLVIGAKVGASLAQIGEFSFILTGVGMSLGLLGAEARDLILAGAILSIALNRALFSLVERVGKSPSQA